MKLAIVLALPLSIPFALSFPSPHRRQTIEQITDNLLFSVTISAFEAARAAQDPPNLDWSSDGCSDSPDNPLGFNFLPSCHRHDFGYRNYKKQSRFTDANKLKIDNNFKSDLYNECAKEDTLEEIACKALADVYYEAVREFGSKKREGKKRGV